MIILILVHLIALFIYSFLSIIASIFSILPFYDQLNSLFADAIGYAKGIVATLPYLEVVWDCFLIAITIEVMFIVFKILLGPRWWGSTN